MSFRRGAATPGSSAKLSKTSTAFTALGTTLQVAKDVSEALESVPYVKSLAGVILLILQIRDEIIYLKDFSRELIELIAARSLPILRGLQSLKVPPARGLESLKEDLEGYHCVLHDVYCALAELTTRHTLFKFRHRDEIKSNLERYRRKLDDIHATFNVSRLTEITKDVKLLVESQVKIDEDAPPIGDFMFQEPLPPPRRVFIGRSAEIDHHLWLLNSCTNPHIAIIGPGGIGKTSFAICLLHHEEMRAIYPDTRYFVSCEQVTTLAALLNGIADVLCITPAERGPALQKNVLQHLRRSPTLLCLDNFEDPWDADGQRRYIEAFLEHLDALPALGLIITTRVAERPSRMSWTDSHSDVLSPLRIADAIALFEQISKCQDPRIADLVNSVECLPLAIELLAQLAARVSLDTLMVMWESEGLRVFDGGNGKDTRLTSVPASIRLSLSSLRVANHPSATSILRLLSELPDGIALSTVKHIQSFLPSSVPLQQSLRVLCSASLAYIDENDRYRILAPIRQYAQDFILLERELMCGLTLAFANLLVEDCEPSTSLHFHFTARELSNTEAMILKGLPLWDSEQQPEDFILAANSSMYWQQYIAQSDLQVLHTALQHATALDSQAMCYHTLGYIAMKLDDYDEAEQSLRKAIALFHDIGDVSSEGMSWKTLGQLHMYMEHFWQSESDWKKAIFLFRQTHDLGEEGEVLLSLGGMLIRDQSGRYRDAEAVLLHALAISSQHGDVSGEAQARHFLGELYIDCFRFGDAKVHVLQALEHAKHMNHPSREAWGHFYMGQVYTMEHCYAAAKMSFQNAAALFHQTKYIGQEAWAHLLLGQLYLQMHHLDEFPTTNLLLECTAQEISVSISLFRQWNGPNGQCEEEIVAERCLYFLELPMLDLCFDAPEPIMWEPIQGTHDDLITRIFGLGQSECGGEPAETE